METREHWVSELKEIAPLLSTLQRTNYFSAPEGYFEAFGLQMIELVEQEVAVAKSELDALQKSLQQQVPAGYFNHFSGEVLRKIKAEEIHSLAPTLAKIPKKQSFEVPAGYFQEFPQQMLRQVSQTDKAPAVPSWWDAWNEAIEKAVQFLFRPQYTLAFAGTASMIVIGSLFFLQIQEQQCRDFYCQLEKVTDEELNAYFEDHADEFEQSMLDVSANESQPLNFESADLHQLSDRDLDEAILD
ncbi:MAG: hypothetical protein IPH78_04480 [Bacteroidetes bacterium]|nr:hypothetical protein [Bacteroidota bacterium]